MAGVLRWGARDKARHLVVLCHGVGADASQMAFFVDAWAPHLPHAAFLALDAPHPFSQGPAGFEWFSLADRTPAVLEAGVRRAATALDAAVDAECARLDVAPAQVALAGFSQGAMMALFTGLRRPVPPAAILGYSGMLLGPGTLPQEITGRTPVLLFHGESDDAVAFVHGLQAEQVLRGLGVPVETCWRPGLGHSIDTVGLSAGLALLRQTSGAST